MSPTFSLLAAGLLLAQAGDAPLVSSGETKTQTYVTGNPAPTAQSGWTFKGFLESRPILSRIQNLLRKNDAPATTAVPASAITTEEPPLLKATTPAVAPTTPAPSGEFLKKLPSSKVSTVEGSETVTTVALKTPVTAKKTPISAAFEQKIGRDEKFEWVTGQLEKEGSVYKIYYATPETVDPHHGVIQLDAAKMNMSGYQSGDLVSVRGNLTQRTRATPIYQVTNIDVIERAKR